MPTKFTLGPATTYRIEGPPFSGLPAGFNGFPQFSLRSWLDLNQDGWTDLLVLGGHDPNAGSAWSPRPGFLAFGTPDGYRLATAAEFPSALMDVHAREVSLADFNGDGVNDVYVADHGYDAPPFPGYQNRLVLSAGAGRWIDASSELPQGFDFTHSVSVGDLNRDGALDVVVGNTGSPPNVVNVLFGDGRGHFRAADPLFLPIGQGAPLDPTRGGILASTVSDMDGDGWPDLVAGMAAEVAPGSSPLRVLWNSAGRFEGLHTSMSYPSQPIDAVQPLDIAVTDINFDGRPDLVATYTPSFETNTTGWYLRVYLNQGERQFREATLEMLSQPGAASGIGAWVGDRPPVIFFFVPHDFNGDGRQDYFVELGGVFVENPAASLAPVVLLSRPLGGFEVITLADLRAAGLTKHFFLGMSYAQRGPGVPGELSNQWWSGDDGATFVFRATIQFPAASSVWQAGGPGADILRGGSGADWFGGFAGDDRLDGGAGIDLARFAVLRADATLLRTGGGWEVTSTAEGRDTLLGIERVWFADRHVALDLDGHAGVVARLLGTLFGKSGPANATFVGIGPSLLDGGMTAIELATAAIGTDAFAGLAGGRSNARFVDFVYRNVVGSAPSPQEQAWLLGILDRAEVSQAELALMASNTEVLAQQIGLAGLFATGLTYEPYGF